MLEISAYAASARVGAQATLRIFGCIKMTSVDEYIDAVKIDYKLFLLKLFPKVGCT